MYNLISSMPKSFWSEVVMTACYLTNITYFTALNGDSLYELWYGKYVDYSMLTTFNCVSFFSSK